MRKLLLTVRCKDDTHCGCCSKRLATDPYRDVWYCGVFPKQLRRDSTGFHKRTVACRRAERWAAAEEKK